MSRSTAASKAEGQNQGVNDEATESVETRRRNASPMIVRSRLMGDDSLDTGLTPRLFED
jgi:hypothetical protein